MDGLSTAGQQRVMRDKARVFLALWPDPEVRAAMAKHQGLWRWPPKAARVRPEKLHLTLHFIGDVERRRLPELRLQLAVHFEPFHLSLGCAELWPHGIATLRPTEPPANLMHLQAELGASLQQLNLPVETRKFLPHITLCRRAGEATVSPQPPIIEWDVDGYVLVESEFDARRTYTVLARYPLLRLPP